MSDLLWEPSVERAAAARISHFVASVRPELVSGRDPSAYASWWRWSVSDLDGFWSSFAGWYGVRWHDQPTATLGRRAMPGTEWFPGSTLNYAEHALFPPAAPDGGDLAVLFEREDGRSRALTWQELRDEVASVRAVLARRGVGRGDRVAALVPNTVEALVAMLATVSLGGVWSSCSPDFGAGAVSDRFTQIEPVVLIAVDGYHYGGKQFEIGDTVRALRAELPSVHTTIVVPYLDPDLDVAAALPDALGWPEIVAEEGDLAFAPMPFDAPMWILYSSGTTGLPKPIVHGQGGILVEHAKQLALHLDLGLGDRFFWFSTTGWMMWNLLVSGLVVGSAVVLYDGSPTYPSPDALWRLAERAGITCFGVSAPYLQACMRAGIEPGRELDLSSLRTVGSTGAPLPPEGFSWVYDHVQRDVLLSSLSGGTDVCTAFVGGTPVLPVHAGVIPGRMLGCAVEAWDAEGRSVVGEVGELVITEPMPSMPVAFWNDPDGSRLREAYFEHRAGVWPPGVWRHGDWITIAEDGSCVISGRSDSTLNRGGVRMGTSEFYRVVENVAGVADSLVVDTSGTGGEGRLLLFVVLDADRPAALDEVRDELRRAIRGSLSPRHVPDEIVQISAVPRTLNGKKCEVPVKRVLAGEAVDAAVSLDALANPEAMEQFTALGGSEVPGASI